MSTGAGTSPSPGVDEAALETLRSAFGGFATGVTIVTCLDSHGHWAGLTVNSFNSLSMSPPLVLWSLRRASPSLRAFSDSEHFAVNILAADQVELSHRFAMSRADRFGVGQWSEGLGGAPVLEDCVAVLECACESRQEAGDHVLFIGRVLRARRAHRPPLVYHAGRYRSLGVPLAPGTRRPA